MNNGSGFTTKMAHTLRSLATTYQYMDYTIVDYGNGRYVFILNNFDARSSQDMEFSFEIINPEAITSESGQFPEKTRSVVVIQSGDYYSLSDYKEGTAIYCGIVAGFCVMLLLLTFTTIQSIWMPIVDFFHYLFILLFINMIMPPNPTYCLSKSIYLTLNFLPNMFSEALSSTPSYDKSISSTMYTFFGDMIFVRSQGFLLTVLVVLGCVLLVMLLLWRRKVGFARKFCKKFLKETFWKEYVHALVYLFFLPCFVIGMMKMRAYAASTTPGESTSVLGFSIFLSYVFMVTFLGTVIYFAIKIFRLMRRHPDTC